MKSLKSVILLPSLWALAAASASASTTTGKVLQVGAYRDPAVAFVLLDGQHTAASCAVNTAWTYVLPMSTEQDKKMFAMLIEAHATGRTATIVGTGACNDFSGIESITYITNN